MTPRQEIIDRYSRLNQLGETRYGEFSRRTAVTVVHGPWVLKREVIGKLVAITAHNRDTGLEPLRASWSPLRSFYDYHFTTYMEQVCEDELLPALRKLFLLDDLSKI